MNYTPRIAVDFDGVIYKRDHLDVGNHTFHGDPVPGAMHFLSCIIVPFEVIIFSSRFAGYDGEQQILPCKVWMKKHLELESRRRELMKKKGYDVDKILSKLDYSATKPVARVYLDDRAWLFTGTFPTIPQLLKFSTWDNR